MSDKMHRLLGRALKEAGDCYTFDDIMVLIRSGNMQSFAHEETWVITQVLDFPRRRVLQVFMVVGALPALQVLEPQVVEFAKKIGATRIDANGRRGFERVYNAFDGWKPGTTSYYKDLVDG